MEWVEVRGRTVQVAVEAALAELGIEDAERAEIEVLESPDKGFLGIGRKDALVRVKPKPAQRRRRRGGRGRGGEGGGTDGGRSGNGRQGGGEGRGRSQDHGSGRGNQRSGNGGRGRGQGSGQKGSDGDGRGTGGRNGGGRGDGGRDSGGQGDGRGKQDRSDGRRSDGRNGRGRDGRGRDGRPGGNNNRTGGGDARGAAAAGSGGARVDGDRDGGTVSTEEQAQVVEDFLKGLLDAFGLDGSVVTRVEDDIIYANVDGEQTEALVGQKATIMNSIHELLRTVVQRKTMAGARVRLDIGGYGERRREALTIYAGRLAAQVKDEGAEIMLEPMNAADRKVVHDAVGEIGGVQSFSEGEDPRRCVVIAPAAGSDEEE